MPNPEIRIENIEEMRRSNGIEDVELQEQISRLTVGDLVKLTFVSDARPSMGETLAVRITRRRGVAMCGKLADRPALSSLSKLRPGSRIMFNSAHVHSIPKGVKHGP